MQNLSYSFDPAGDLQTITDNATSARTQGLQYDALYRLTQAAGVYGTFTYGYDATGNRTAQSLTTSGGTSSATYNYAATSNQLQSVVTGATTRTLSYGATGNITNDDFGTGTVTGFTYDEDNRMVGASVAAPGQFTSNIVYEYDFLGHRVFKQQGNVFHFLYDRAGHLIAESVGVNSVRYFDEYVWLDDLPVAFIFFGSTLDFVHTDHLGAPQKMTDSAQNVVWDGATSDPFVEGPLPTNPPMHLRLPGQYFDTETGLHHNGMRDGACPTAGAAGPEGPDPRPLHRKRPDRPRRRDQHLCVCGWESRKVY